MLKKILFSFLAFCIINSALCQETLHSIAEKFTAPTMEYRPNVWWHWLGSNFTVQGITKDLEAMAESGIGGACIFNIASSVQESHFPMENLPFPNQTFRSPAYWNAMKHTMKEAQRLNLTMGLHGTPGYATTGGPWISEERGMKAIISSKTIIDGGRTVEIALPKPELPEYTGYDSRYLPDYHPHKAHLYWDITVMAVPEKEDLTVDDIIELRQFTDTSGTLRWNVPAGRWTIYRYGYAPTMAHPHPLPDDLIGKTLEVDKMSRKDNIYHWTELLEPLKENIGEYFGNTFKYIWIDSYESGYQNWTEDFREQFIRIKNYDVVRWIAFFQYKTGKDLEYRFNAWTNNELTSGLPEFKRFLQDYNDVVNRLYMDNGFAVAREMLHKYGLKLYWEPYGGPFSNYEGSAMADVPADEFWSSQKYVHNNPNTYNAAVQFGKRIVAAEAFTGTPSASGYTETPAFLKHTADGGFSAGMNLYFLHHWVHQPFDDKYKPALGMGWWGTHFSRYQTWYKESKAFFTYLARCQMLLQQGSPSYYSHRITPEADIYFVTNPFDEKLDRFAFPLNGDISVQIWDAYTGESSPAARRPGDISVQIWDAYTGKIYHTNDFEITGDSVFVTLNLEKDHSAFVVFPLNKTHYATAPIAPPFANSSSSSASATQTISGKWNVTFIPKTDEKSFTKTLEKLVDLSKESDKRLKYFSGTAVYENTVVIPATAAAFKENTRTVLDLGEVHDMATVEINGKEIGVLWFPPFKVDITDCIKAGENTLKISVTNTWANRLIGDEQYPADFEWGTDRGAEGRAMKKFPDWFVKNSPRPEQRRKTFNIWYYYRKNSELQPSGLLGHVSILYE